MDVEFFGKGIVMQEYLKTEKGVLYQGDVFEVLKSIPDESVDCVVTSPPYWGLRDYGVDGQIGLEPTFQGYLENLWKVFDGIWRVLKPTGTCWIVMGDVYNTAKTVYANLKNKYDPEFNSYKKENQKIKRKSLIMIPERFAIGMIERGWVLRNQIIWHKPNGKPESARDRFTVNFEKIFFFSKNQKYYFKQQLELANYDGRKKDVLEPARKYGSRNYPLGQSQQMARKPVKRWPNQIDGKPARNKRAVWSINTKGFKEAHFAVFPQDIPQICIDAGCPKDGVVLDPFMGSGTVALVAEQMDRKWIGIELNPEYCEIVRQRLEGKL